MMRRSITAICIVLAACGGSTPPEPPPPPPPPPPTPSVVEVSAGDGQQAAPGTAVATPPAVTVRSSNGTPVPNVTVTFAIDSGGGTVGSPTATTNASGVASPGSWTVGAVEGPQVLVATVAGVAPARIRALSRIPTTQIGTGTVAVGGGVLSVNQPGSPLHGLTISFPDGAVTTPAPITMAMASTAGISLPAGVTAATPALVLTTSVRSLARSATIRFPAPAPIAGQTLMVGAFNPATGGFTVLPSLGVRAGSVLAALPTLAAAAAPVRPGTSPAGFPAASLSADEDPLHLLLVGVPNEVFDKPFDSKFRVRQDNWDFDNRPVAALPFLAGPGAQPDEAFYPTDGMVATSLWYFEHRKAEGPLYGRFRLQADQAASNRVGIRWAALASIGVSTGGARAIAEAEELATDDPADYGETLFKAIRALFYTTYDRPVPVALYDVVIGGQDSLTPVGLGIATRVSGNEVEIVVPDNPEVAFTATFTPGVGFNPFTVSAQRGGSFEVRALWPLLHRPLIEGPALADQYPKVLAETVGDAEGWPTPSLHWNQGELDPKGIFLDDRLIHWWECGACPDFGFRPPGIPATAPHPQVFQMARIVAGTSAPFTAGALATVRWSRDSVGSDAVPTRTGHAIYLPQPASGTFIGGWLDWQTVDYRRASLRPTPGSVAFSKDTTINVTLNPSQPLPSGTTYSWVLRTDAGRDSVATTTAAHTRNLKAGTKGKLLIIAHEKGSKRPIARDSIPIESSALPFWQITSISDPDDVLDTDTGDGDPFYPMMARLLAAPGSGLIAIESEASGGTVLRLRVLPNALWSPGNCCPPSSASFPGEFQFSLGVQPTVTYAVGPYFAGFGESRWAQSTDDLGSGTMTAQFVHGGLIPRAIENAGTQNGPRDLIRFSATRSGASMTGTIEVYGWGVDEKTGEVPIDGNPGVLRLPFTAVRLR